MTLIMMKMTKGRGFMQNNKLNNNDQPLTDMGEVSDGYHTFNELYDHRAILFSVICNQNSDIAWKSKLHEDGTMYDGMFIVGMNIPGNKQVSYHVENKYWDIFKIKELFHAPKYTGYTSSDVLEILKEFGYIHQNERNRLRDNLDYLKNKILGKDYSIVDSVDGETADDIILSDIIGKFKYIKDELKIYNMANNLLSFTSLIFVILLLLMLFL